MSSVPVNCMLDTAKME